MKREIKGRDRRMNTLVWPQKIRICEVGPRDGLQNEKVSLSVEQKLDLIERTVDAGAKALKSALLSIRRQYLKWLILTKLLAA